MSRGRYTPPEDLSGYVNAVTDTGTINLTLAGQSISGAVIPGGIDHDALLNVHQDVTVTASPTWVGATITGGAVLGLNSAVFQPTTDSTTFFQILNATGNSFLTGDTTNNILTLESFDTTDPTLRFKTTNTANQIDFYLDESITADYMIIEGQTPLVDTFLGVKAKVGETAALRLSVGTLTGSFSVNPEGNIQFASLTNNKDVQFIVRTGDAAVEAMRIDGATQFVGIGEIAPETLTEWTSTVPYLTLHNSTHEDTDGGRECRINFKGEQGVDPFEETTLARIEAWHDGTGADDKGELVFYVNDGNDGDTPGWAMRIDAAHTAYFENSMALADYGTLYFGDSLDYGIYHDSNRLIIDRLVGTAEVWIGSTHDETLIAGHLFSDGNMNIGYSAMRHTWKTYYDVLEIGGTGALYCNTSLLSGMQIGMAQNAYFDETDERWEYAVIDEASLYAQTYGRHIFYVNDGTGAAAGGPISFTAALTLDEDGDATFTGSITTDEHYEVDGTQVVSNQGVAVANATDAPSTMARLNDLLARCRAHGLIAT